MYTWLFHIISVQDMGSNSQAHGYPGTDPPPYPGPPPGPSYPAHSGYTAQAGYAVTNQPVTMVHPTTTVIHGSSMYPAVIVTNGMAPGPTHYVCRSCNQQIITRVERIPSMRTHMCAGILCLLGYVSITNTFFYTQQFRRCLTAISYDGKWGCRDQNTKYKTR